MGCRLELAHDGCVDFGERLHQPAFGDPSLGVDLGIPLTIRPGPLQRLATWISTSIRYSEPSGVGRAAPGVAPANPRKGDGRRSPEGNDGRQKRSGGDLLSRAVSRGVPSALEGLTSVFGMGTGVTPPI